MDGQSLDNLFHECAAVRDSALKHEMQYILAFTISNNISCVYDCRGFWHDAIYIHRNSLDFVRLKEVDSIDERLQSVLFT